MSETQNVILITAAIMIMAAISMSIIEPDLIENYIDGLYFVICTLSTVGYGDISPQTFYGKAFTIALSILGLGIFAAFVEVVNEWRSKIIKTAVTQDKISAVFITLTTLVCLGGSLFAYLEGWETSDALYFSFISATSVGYGDIAPATTNGRLAAIFFILFSLAPMAFVVNEIKTFLLLGFTNKKDQNVFPSESDDVKKDS